MRLRSKLTIATLSIVLILVAGGYASSYVARREMRQSLIRATATTAAQILGSINAGLQTQIEHLRAMTRGLDVREALMQSNTDFEQMGGIRERIAEVDGRWTSAAPGELQAMAAGLIANRLAVDLRNRQATQGFRLFGEVFITNRYGANVAQTGLTTDYYQADEDWWQQAAQWGAFVGSVEYDESAAVVGVPVAVRVESGEGALLGVLKAVLTPDGLLAPLTNAGILPWEQGMELTLLGPDGRAVYTARQATPSDGAGVPATVPLPAQMQGLSGYGPGLDVQYGLIGPERLVVSVRGEHEEGAPAHRGHPGWTLLVTRDLRRALKPLDRLQRAMLFISLAATGTAVAIGFGVSTRIAHALSQISAAAEKLGRGDLDARAPVRSNDEIGALAAGFNAMAARLKQTTASRDALEREVAQRRRAEREREVYARRLERLNAELERSNRDLQDFTHTVSHDLQEPLRKIHSFGQFLEEDCGEQLPPTGREHLHRMLDAVLRMKALIQHLLALARVGTRGGELLPVAPARIVETVLDTLSERIRETEARVAVEDGMPRVMADEVQLGQVFQNLVGNALKFCTPGRPPRIEIGGRAEDGRATFSVSDNGIGIEAEYLDEVFGVFRRLHSRDEYEGAGVGLALCAKIVHRHGGRIWAESELGVGTTFRFTLPLAEEAEEEKSLEHQ